MDDASRKRFLNQLRISVAVFVVLSLAAFEFLDDVNGWIAANQPVGGLDLHMIPLFVLRMAVAFGTLVLALFWLVLLLSIPLGALFSSGVGPEKLYSRVTLAGFFQPRFTGAIAADDIRSAELVSRTFLAKKWTRLCVLAEGGLVAHYWKAPSYPAFDQSRALQWLIDHQVPVKKPPQSTPVSTLDFRQSLAAMAGRFIVKSTIVMAAATVVVLIMPVLGRRTSANAIQNSFFLVLLALFDVLIPLLGAFIILDVGALVDNGRLYCSRVPFRAILDRTKVGELDPAVIVSAAVGEAPDLWGRGPEPLLEIRDKYGIAASFEKGKDPEQYRLALSWLASKGIAVAETPRRRQRHRVGGA